MRKRASHALLIIALSLVAFGGCYGPFAVTKKVYDWNGTVQDKFVRSGVFWIFVIVPVYPLCALGDTLIFNPIEFWTGSNPITSNDAGPPDVERLADGSIQLEHQGHVYALRHVDARGFEVWLDGVHVGNAIVGADGSLALSDLESGRSVAIDSSQIEALRQKLPTPTVANEGVEEGGQI